MSRSGRASGLQKSPELKESNRANLTWDISFNFNEERGCNRGTVCQRVITPGRSLMPYLFQLSTEVKLLHHHVRLDRDALSDLNMWVNFLEIRNGNALFLESTFTSDIALSLYTNASGGVGFGGILGREWFVGKWEGDFIPVRQHIRESSLLEIVPVVIAAKIWSALWTRHKILMHPDNEALVSIINKGRSKSPAVMHFS
ncbi:unnamed protein product [Didymodactylos carnosus]|uniref:Uncharacterized protein n=1 Tax=Didymodactylos carnosus TaxID=1234261 RepID=A0A814K5K2_9BILA|nr:unnamed protein product [Didymodactylos carnosus]CAF3817706.1 unnamed protein product [Didymodactylos carnosus]